MTMKIRPVIEALALAALTLAVFLPVLKFGYVHLDDNFHILSNPYVKRGLDWQSVSWAFTAGLTRYSFYVFYWSPLTYLSYMVEWQFFGPNPHVSHAVNLGLHLCNVLLLFLILWKTTRRLNLSWIAAAFFAVHPVQVETVAWISARKDVLGFFFALLSLGAYAHSRKQAHAGPAYAFSALTFGLAVMAKISLVALPLLFVVMDYWPLERKRASETGRASLRRFLYEKWLLFFALYAGGWLWALKPFREDSLPGWPLIPLKVFSAYSEYLVRLFWPDNLGIYGAPNVFRVPGLGPVLFAFLCFAFVTWGAVRIFGKRPYVSAGWFWFVLMLAPAVFIVPQADRYMYGPCIGIFIMLVWLLDSAVSKFRGGSMGLAVLAVALLLACAGVSGRQIGVWRDDGSLFRRAVEINPDNYVAQNNLGIVLGGQGNLPGSLVCFQQAIRLKPDYALAYNNIGVTLAAMGREEEAFRYFLVARVHDRGLTQADVNIIRTAIRLKKPEGLHVWYRDHLKRLIENTP
jgi:hypothetical protein